MITKGGLLIDIQRAEQIIASPNKITVTYQGVPVWIHSLNASTQMAKVHTEGNSKDEKTIPVQDLIEVRES